MDLIGNRTLRDLIAERTDRHPDKDCLVFEAADESVTTFTYQQLFDGVNRTAAGLLERGIQRGDAVVLHLPNCPEFLFAWLGLAWIGAVAVPSNTANTGPELEHVLEHSQAIGIISSETHLASVTQALQHVPTVRIRLLARTSTATEGFALFADVLSGPAPVTAPGTAPNGEDVMQFIFTSGTTARPKAVMLTHANCLRSGERASRTLAADASDRFLTALPAFHVNAQSMTILAALTVGGTIVLLEEYRASRFMDQVRRHSATAVSLVAMQLRTLLAQPETELDRHHRLRRNFYAINVLEGEKEEFERRFGLELMNGYGLSEAMTIVTAAPIFGDKRWPSIGLPAYDRVVRVVDPDGNDVPTGETGEIVVSGVPGRTLMKGYFRDPDATADALREGWLHTGDNGYFDEAGYLFFYDRKKDVIKRAGENISASEVEQALLCHPLIAEAAVIGVPDPLRDEAVKAFVVISGPEALSEDDVLAHCREQLSYFKVPSFIEIRSSLPKTSIGKIEKKLLRQAESASTPG